MRYFGYALNGDIGRYEMVFRTKSFWRFVAEALRLKGMGVDSFVQIEACFSAKKSRKYPLAG